jgi:hypothetical protein
MWDLSKTMDDRKKHKITFVSRLNGEKWTSPPTMKEESSTNLSQRRCRREIRTK